MEYRTGSLIGRLASGLTLLLSVSQFSLAQCTTNAQGVTNCSLSADFTTGGQSLFATGNGTVSFSGTIGASWNESGSVGSIVNQTVAGQNIGDYGKGGTSARKARANRI